MAYFLPLISALIGWITNYIAVKMLFYPRRKREFLGMSIQGVFPKRKVLLAERLGELVAKELFSVEMVREKIQDESLQVQMREALNDYLDKNLLEELKKVNPMLAMFATPEIVAPIQARIVEQISQVLPLLVDKLGKKIEEIDIRAMVRTKVIAFSDEKLESILLGVMQKELRFIEWAGAFLGFLIGLLQLFLLKLS